MALSLDELAKKYKAGTMTDADLKESGYMMHQVENYVEESNEINEIPMDMESTISENLYQLKPR